MTQTPETPNNRIDQLEATLTRFAELSFQSYRQHDEALSRLEANVSRHDEALSRLEANVSRHDEALSRLEANVSRHDEAISRIEEGFFRMEGAITDLSNQQQRTDRALEAMTTSVTDLVRSMASEAIQANRDRAAWQAEIQRIWQYLESQTGNGNGRSADGQ